MGLVCADWQYEGNTTGLKCADGKNCEGQETFKDITYHIACKGLKGAKCDVPDECDTVANMTCGGWVDSSNAYGGKKCAESDKCGGSIDFESKKYSFYCEGLDGDGCNGNRTCVNAINLRCGDTYKNFHYANNGTCI